MNTNTDIIHCMHISKSCGEYFNIIICNLYFCLNFNFNVAARVCFQIMYVCTII